VIDDDFTSVSRRCLILGVLFVALGVLFYIFLRPESPAMIASLQTALPVFWVDRNSVVYHSFPTFSHLLGFSFLSVAFLSRTASKILMVAIFWLFINIGYEVSCLSPDVVAIYASMPSAGYVCTFDMSDLWASVFAALAFVLIMFYPYKLH